MACKCDCHMNYKAPNIVMGFICLLSALAGLVFSGMSVYDKAGLEDDERRKAKILWPLEVFGVSLLYVIGSTCLIIGAFKAHRCLIGVSLIINAINSVLLVLMVMHLIYEHGGISILHLIVAGLAIVYCICSGGLFQDVGRSPTGVHTSTQNQNEENMQFGI